MSAKQLFIVGTGTDVGKTYVSGQILKSLIGSGRRAAYFKPAMSGNASDASGRPLPGDAIAALGIAGSDQPASSACSFVYENAVSPHLAARWEGRPFDPTVAKRTLGALASEYDYVLAEGAGGVTCPMIIDGERQLLLLDLIAEWGIPCLLVADAGLGTINYVALTAWTLKARGIPLKGVILNRWTGDPMQQDNAVQCARLSGAPVLGTVAEDAGLVGIGPDALAALFN